MISHIKTDNFSTRPYKQKGATSSNTFFKFER